MRRTSIQANNRAGIKSARRKRAENKYAGKSIKSLSGIKHAQKKFLKIKQNRTSACIKQEFNKIQDSIMQE
jgi:hypothetical protein